MASSPFIITEHTVDCQHIREYPHATRHGDDALQLAVKQYIPKSNPNPQPGDVTIIGAHSSGVPKELYEPIWEELLAKLEHQGVRIRSIWIADTASQGASGLLNKQYLGNDPSWFDHSRDLLHLVNTFKAEMPRPIVGIGHSLGAGQLALLSLMHSRLFTSLVLIESVFGRDILSGKGLAFAQGSLAAPDNWASRASAAAYFQKRHRSWDPRVLDRFLKYGLRDVERESSSDKAQREVTLTTTQHQDVMQYLRANFSHRKPLRPDTETDTPEDTHDPLFHPDVIGPAHAIAPFYRCEPLLAYKLLKHVRPSVLYIFGEKSPISTPKPRAEKVERTGRGFGGSGGYRHGRVREVTLPAAGHQVPFEDIAGVSSATAEWVKEEMLRWKRDEERITHGWVNRSVEDRLSLSEEWQARLKESLGKYKLARSKL
ncbi:alpha/beta-hydrolase [Aspergillus homomorphus CBS 101889]|uniref:Alpha/beta-hydrolase n=1 Tax=Aspergillus homomorphus (strain CBS 101889) TaxID=1450537 RepID=A0A395IE61_ASPHC|nr:alpha/beta-hydrolase [Aspergillus homomorphus CBS 101889]RAL17453.1 alpha/beta-hydrolase [Aspergillus homomorphus CBS 101889]